MRSSHRLNRGFGPQLPVPAAMRRSPFSDYYIRFHDGAGIRPLPRIGVSDWTQARFGRRAGPGGVAFWLRVMLNFAVRQGHIEGNPARCVKFLAEGPGCSACRPPARAGKAKVRRDGKLQLGYTRHPGRANPAEVNAPASSPPFDFSRCAGVRNRTAASLPCVELCPPRSPSPGYLLSGGSRKFSLGLGGPPSDQFSEP
jgi:hypothetical protein